MLAMHALLRDDQVSHELRRPTANRGHRPPARAGGPHPSPAQLSFIVFIYTLFASLTGLPALLTGAAPVSRVCQVFGCAKRLTVTRPAAQRRAPTHIPPAIGRFGGGSASSVSFAARIHLGSHASVSIC